MTAAFMVLMATSLSGLRCGLEHRRDRIQEPRWIVRSAVWAPGALEAITHDSKVCADIGIRCRAVGSVIWDLAHSIHGMAWASEISCLPILKGRYRAVLCPDSLYRFPDRPNRRCLNHRNAKQHIEAGNRGEIRARLIGC